MPMNRDRALRVMLRSIGSVSLTALVFVAVPEAWMDAIHRWLGMGALPNEPVVGYLARSTSAFYAAFGALMWVVSFDLDRYRAVVTYLATVFVLLGAALLVIDWAEGMPLFWKAGEGPVVIGFGVVMHVLNWRGSAGE